MRYWRRFASTVTSPSRISWCKSPRNGHNHQHGRSTGQDDVRLAVSREYRRRDSSKNAEKENYNRNWPHANWTIWKLAFDCGGTYKSRRPSIAFIMVTSSAYSKSAPTGIPTPMRDTRTPSGFSSFDRYIAVASPSAVGLVATMISSTDPPFNRSISCLIFN